MGFSFIFCFTTLSWIPECYTVMQPGRGSTSVMGLHGLNSAAQFLTVEYERQLSPREYFKYSWISLGDMPLSYLNILSLLSSLISPFHEIAYHLWTSKQCHSLTFTVLDQLIVIHKDTFSNLSPCLTSLEKKNMSD